MKNPKVTLIVFGLIALFALYNTINLVFIQQRDMGTAWNFLQIFATAFLVYNFISAVRKYKKSINK